MKPVETCRNRQISVAVCTAFVDYISIVTALYCAFTIRLHLPVFLSRGISDLKVYITFL